MFVLDVFVTLSDDVSRLVDGVSSSELSTRAREVMIDDVDVRNDVT